MLNRLRTCPQRPCPFLVFHKASDRLLLMSWNPGWGARKLGDVVDQIGYHLVLIQEARPDFLSGLSRDRWSWVSEAGQFIGARRPAEVRSVASRETGPCPFLVAEVTWPSPRLGFECLRIMSLHLHHITAKKAVAGPTAFAEAIDAGSAAGPLHLLAGDINMARWRREKADAAAGVQWQEATLEVLEKRSFLPIADWEAECCFIAMRVEDVARLHVRGSSWGERSAGADEAARKEHWAGFLEQVGARPTSKDVHWPMSLALRVSATSGQRSSGLRRRSAEATARRNSKKAERGFGPWAASRPHQRHIHGSGASSSGQQPTQTHSPERPGSASSRPCDKRQRF